MAIGFLNIASVGFRGLIHSASRNSGSESLATGAPFNGSKGGSNLSPTKQQQSQGPRLVFMNEGDSSWVSIAEHSPHDPNPYLARTVSLAPFLQIRQSCSEKRRLWRTSRLGMRMYLGQVSPDAMIGLRCAMNKCQYASSISFCHRYGGHTELFNPSSQQHQATGF
jgi:hypothetical protein